MTIGDALARPGPGLDAVAELETENAAVRVLLVSDSPILLAGMLAMMRAERFVVAGSVHTFVGLRTRARAARADVVLVAPSDGITEELRDELHGLPQRAVVLLWDSGMKIHGAAVSAKAGFPCIPLTARTSTIAGALRSAALSDAPLQTVEVVVTARGRLTPREQEVLCCLSRGMKNQEIADDLHLALETVKAHLQRVFRKLGVGSRSEAVSAYLSR